EIGGTLVGVTACPAGNAGWSGTLPSQAVNASPSPTATPSGSTHTPTFTFTSSPTITPTFTLSPNLTATPTPVSTAVPNVTPTPTGTPGLPAALILAPNLAGDGQPICLFPDKPITNSKWDIYNLVGERIAGLSFGNGNACWNHAGTASGLYLIRVRTWYEDGGTADKIFKAIILR
ncbi:MAG TPA: hypothetical protein VK859_01095, partial [bacterium]|nr:hypothetical protein [bacterium]